MEREFVVGHTVNQTEEKAPMHECSLALPTVAALLLAACGARSWSKECQAADAAGADA